jgi:hypothetical protein
VWFHRITDPTGALGSLLFNLPEAHPSLGPDPRSRPVSRRITNPTQAVTRFPLSVDSGLSWGDRGWGLVYGLGGLPGAAPSMVD